ncbi:MAG: urease accessory protein UreF [Pseudomonadota bacterium]
MTTDALLTLTQWLSPGFPVGAFAYSHGLERAIDDGALRDAETLSIWLEDILRFGSGRADAILLVAACSAAPEDVQRIDSIGRAFAATRERLTETVDQGGAFASTVDAIWDTDIGPLSYPVAVGRAARARDVPLQMAVELYLHAFAANLVSAAVRLVPLGQTEGQAVLAGLSDTVRAVAADALALTLDDLSSATFAADIASMRHETQYAKVFRT